MKTVRLESGINLEILDSAKNNMELLDNLAELDSGDLTTVSRIMNQLLSKGEKKKLYDHLRVDGVVPIDKTVDAMKEIFEKMGDDGKN